MDPELPKPPARTVALVLLLVVTVFAGALRAYRLGDWSFAYDELYTFQEADILFGEPPDDLGPGRQKERLAQSIPLGYALHALDYALFGRDEFGSRVLCAVAGTLGVAATFWLLSGVLGLGVATIVAMLVATWPDHLFHSQQNRFYAFAWLFAALTMLFGARAVRSRSTRTTLLACVMGVLAVLTHTMNALVVAALFVALLLGLLVERRGRDEPFGLGRIGRMLAIVAVTGGVLAAFYALWLRPLLAEWNAGVDFWAYSPLRSVLASVNQLGYPVALLAAVGVPFALRWRDGQGLYWLTFAALYAAATLVLPKVVAYHAHYVFPMALAALVLAGMVGGRCAELVWRDGRRLAALALVAGFCLWNLPGTASHFRDGSRDDWRSVADYIEAHWQDGDRVVGTSAGLVEHYAPGIGPMFALSMADPMPTLKEHVSAEGRCWIVIRANRKGVPQALREWLGKRATWVFVAHAPRFDYSDRSVHVFLAP